MAFCSIVNSPIITQFVNVFFRERITVLAFASEAIRVKPSLARFKMFILKRRIVQEYSSEDYFLQLLILKTTKNFKT